MLATLSTEIVRCLREFQQSQKNQGNNAAELEKTLQILLQQSLTHLNLVSREEFDVQQQVLTRTRVQLASLEAQVIELENQLAKYATNPEDSEK